MSNYGTLLELIKEQDKKIDELINNITTLKEHIIRLSICKVTNDEFPYYNFIVTTQLTADQISKIDLLFLITSEYLKNVKITQHHNDLIRRLGIESIFLNNDVEKNELKRYIQSILNVDTWDLPFEMLTKMKEQGVGGQVVDYLLCQEKELDS
ncbi:hypothetical protein [Sporosarcina sp. FSL K6-3457]|uniref:hypothetical protein n=1 Tax=Sporosarcina sp. FSL K6-3457 TaxID=2978204 RepID=UPI0030FC2BFF